MEREEQPERNVEELEERGEQVEQDIEETKRDWEAKQDSSDVPGAVEPEDDSPVEPEDDSQE